MSAAHCFPTAVDGGYKEVVELLVTKGAEVNRTHTASCWTCLHQAVYKVITDLTSTHATLTSNLYIFQLPKGHGEIVRILVNVCSLEALDDHKISPLFLAAQYGQQECLEILVNAGKYILIITLLHFIVDSWSWLSFLLLCTCYSFCFFLHLS